MKINVLGFSLLTSRSLRTLLLMVILTTVVCLSFYLIQTCCSVDLNLDTIDLTPDHVELNKNPVDVSRIKDNLVTGDIVENSIKELSLRKKDTSSSSLEVQVTGQVYTDKGGHSNSDKITLYSPSLGERYITKSNADGFFQFNEVIAADDYQLTVTPRGLYRHYNESISITAPYSQLYIQLESRLVNTLRGHIFNLDQVPVAGLKLKIRSQDTIKWDGAVTSDSIGYFELADVPVGYLTFHSTREGIVLSIRGYELQNDQHHYLNLTVDRGPHDISGNVFDQYGEPAVGANVVVNWEYLDGNKRAFVTRRTITKQDGSFSLSDLGPGQHELTVVDLSNGATHKQVLNLSSDSEELLIYLK